MKKLLCSLLAITFLATSAVASAASQPFFLEKIVWNQTVENRFVRIKITATAPKNAETNAKLTQTRQFVSQVKKEALKRYADGRITRYEAEDIAHELEYLTYSMNEYFRNMGSYERTRNRDYLGLADQNLSDAASSYNRLSGITWGTVRK